MSGYVPDVITEAVGSEPTYQMAVEEVASPFSFPSRLAVSIEYFLFIYKR